MKPAAGAAVQRRHETVESQFNKIFTYFLGMSGMLDSEKEINIGVRA